MPRRCLAVFYRAAAVLALAAPLACAHAVEIGEVVVRSYLGQPLVADIELTGFSSEGEAVEARLANPDVFQGANLGMHPVLSNLRMSVMKRDGRQFLHMTTIAPVQTQYVHLFLELADGSRRSVRAASLALVADPRPAPPAPAPAAAVPLPAALPASKPPVAPMPKPVAPAAPKRIAPVTPAPAPVPVAACPKPRYSDDEIRACATRDYKNAMLSAQIVELEEKVRALQAALDAPVAAAAAVPAKAGPPTIRIAPAKNAAPAPGRSFPWLWIGATLAGLALAGLAAAVFVKRRGRPTLAAPARPKGRLMGRLRDAMQRDTGAGGAAGESGDEPGKVAA